MAQIVGVIHVPYHHRAFNAKCTFLSKRNQLLSLNQLQVAAALASEYRNSSPSCFSSSVKRSTFFDPQHRNWSLCHLMWLCFATSVCSNG
ncbi:unnamed protein product [Coregonus sp. 'balchen']|nr:unnamed protein product [Coregonus sp. 'balchen']